MANELQIVHEEIAYNIITKVEMLYETYGEDVANEYIESLTEEETQIIQEVEWSSLFDAKTYRDKKRYPYRYGAREALKNTLSGASNALGSAFGVAGGIGQTLSGVAGAGQAAFGKMKDASDSYLGNDAEKPKSQSLSSTKRAPVPGFAKGKSFTQNQKDRANAAITKARERIATAKSKPKEIKAVSTPPTNTPTVKAVDVDKVPEKSTLTTTPKSEPAKPAAPETVKAKTEPAKPAAPPAAPVAPAQKVSSAPAQKTSSEPKKEKKVTSPSKQPFGFHGGMRTGTASKGASTADITAGALGGARGVNEENKPTMADFRMLQERIMRKSYEPF